MRFKFFGMTVFMLLFIGCPGGSPPGFTLGDAKATDTTGKDTVNTDNVLTDTGKDSLTPKDIVSGKDGIAKDTVIKTDTKVKKDTVTPKDTVNTKDTSKPDVSITDPGVVPPVTTDCKTCKTSTDCSDDFDCMKLGTDKFCLRKCIQGNGDCLPGYECKNYCVPLSGKCEGCVVTGCPANEICNPKDGKCFTPKKTCEQCGYDLECGDKAGCMRTRYGFGLCMPACASDADCPAKYSCQPDNKGIKLCEPDHLSECCPVDRPIMLRDGKCVECTRSSDCKNGEECDRNTFTCHAPCPDGTMACPDDHKCHECCANEDCPGHQKCTNYQCTGDICGCATDADCNSGNTQGLKCSTNGFCYDPTGKCNGETSCCDTGSGSECFDLSSLFGGMGGGMGGGMSISICTCDNGAKCAGSIKCQATDAICNIQFIGNFLCPNGQLPAGTPQHICGDPTKLIGGFGGFGGN